MENKKSSAVWKLFNQVKVDGKEPSPHTLGIKGICGFISKGVTQNTKRNTPPSNPRSSQRRRGEELNLLPQDSSTRIAVARGEKLIPHLELLIWTILVLRPAMLRNYVVNTLLLLCMDTKPSFDASESRASSQSSFLCSSLDGLEASVSTDALTAECWTSLTNASYMTVTAHFINDQLKMVSRVLSTFSLAILNKCRNIVTFFHHNRPATLKLNQLCSGRKSRLQQEVPVPKGLYCLTIRSGRHLLVQKLSLNHSISLLKTKAPSIIHPSIRLIQEHLTEIRYHDFNDVLIMMCSALNLNMKDRFVDFYQSSLHIVLSYLDLRFKTEYLSPNHSSVGADFAEKRVVVKMRNLTDSN
ncbi:hypothetical protein OUZ56_012813 [Daphnia magna]|uniref:Uncharacterized protein n=1 Tax=Daphnia magna TaxID=35525 RepID=A0ABQ9Z586_9CRUS|nr:hypothetical protein OUZ56_012813 [Daphnia magna]